ncbi:hypothetical protein B296_00037326, partial [Ensete ventricosum]
EPSPRKTRFPRACNTRPSAAARPPLPERRPVTRREKEERQKAGRVITSLVQPPPPSQLLRWELRSMWELAAVLDFFHVSASCRKGVSLCRDLSLFPRVSEGCSCSRFCFPRLSGHC